MIEIPKGMITFMNLSGLLNAEYGYIDTEIKDFILNMAKGLFKRLKLPPIRISIDNSFGGARFTPAIPCIEIGKKLIWDVKYNKNEYIKKFTANESHYNKIYFIVAHEIAHYLQMYKFNKWFKYHGELYHKHLSSYGFSTVEIYTNLKVEKIAYKIASILLNEHKKKC